ncbi:relaxase/mobilization nuclease domain-containing protein [uncultured Ruminococcus sp.]|uniref:relaxase/mobilization nuclease domain-containing protein n=1 Tax=uncultured Ruminococcus sp. TaxID=165186 RepID=UPI00292E6781|nr:relaxase/mobilization nuclease domain-containing protein [uncultured Ruminococcus sp.]
MATVIFIKESRQNPSAMRAVINYCQQEYKTFDSRSKRQLVSGINCDGANSYHEFMATKKVYGKADGIFFYQYAQSFSPTEKLTPEQAHEISMEFAERAWPGQEILVATHCDANHLHSHFVINSVSFESGKKLRQSPSTLRQLRAFSDEICLAHGLSVLTPYENGGRRISNREYRARMRGNSWKQKLAEDIDKSAMSILGYRMTWTDERKYLTFHCPNGRSCRDKSLYDEKYWKKNIENELDFRENSDGVSEEKQPTGWENSRELYEQHLRERAYAKAETQKISESYHEPSSRIIGRVDSLAGAVARIVDNDNEDPEERRKRIEGQENGAAIGTLIGTGVGLISSVASRTEEPTESSEEDDYQREEILQEIFDEDDYDDEYYDEEDEGQGFVMSM